MTVENVTKMSTTGPESKLEDGEELGDASKLANYTHLIHANNNTRLQTKHTKH